MSEVSSRNDGIESEFDNKLLESFANSQNEPLDVRKLIIENDNPVWTLLMRFGADILNTEFAPQYCNAKRVTSLSRVDSKVETGLSCGLNRLEWQLYSFDVDVQKGEGSQETATIYLKDFDTCQAFENFLKHAKEFSKRKGSNEAEKINVRVLSNSLAWRIISSYPKRPRDSLIFGDDTVDALLGDMKHFLASEEEYISFGFPFKRNYLIIGDPGTGKSSLVTIAASEFDFDICFLTIKAGMGEKELCSGISSLSNNSILVLEDVDVICTSANNNENANLSLAILTNILDGALHKHKLITILTSTQPTVLETSLMRHGRIDYVTRLSNLNEKQTELMVQKVFGKEEGWQELHKRIWEHVERLRNISSTVLAHFLFKYRHQKPSDVTLKMCEELSSGTNREHINDGKSKPDFFYM